MKIAEINAVPNGSTGMIMESICNVARNSGHTAVSFFGIREHSNINNENQVVISSKNDHLVHYCLGNVTGYNESFSIIATYRLVKKLKKYHPDIIHLHVMHGQYLNISILFKYLKKSGIPVVWTMHDCWAITGRCPHFELLECEKWRTGCYNCHYDKADYPPAKIDRTEFLWKKKKKLFGDLQKLSIVTPSDWLRNIIKESFLQNKEVNVINNGIDLELFKPTNSNFRKEYDCESDFLVLGVASYWSKKKGLDDFIRLSEEGRFKVVLVGTNNEIDQLLPSQIISIHRTESIQKLVEIYSAADVFVNTTYEDTFPTVNIEALACGTPVVTYCTGGSPEIIDNNTGIVIEKGNIERLIECLQGLAHDNRFHSSDCVKRASLFNKNYSYQKYIELFEIIRSKYEHFEVNQK